MLSILSIANIPLDATTLGGAGGFLPWLTNSILVAAIVTVGIIFFARRATARMQVIPSGSQNLFEALIEGLYNLLESIVGRHMIARTFSFLATVFIFILFSNWFSLVPGVGTIGWGPKAESSIPLAIQYATDPLLRPATADLNLTLGLAGLAIILWLFWTLREVGIGGFLLHIFGPKGGMTGIAGIAMAVVFFFVGILEVISIGTRPISLSLRLFGNIYAGENILHMMLDLGAIFKMNEALAFVLSIIASVPFYVMELMVGALQAFVFMLLCAVYIQLSTSHDEEAH